jgi:two-component system cell cycle sensor histidine kinase/response regulator CckA
MGSSLAPVSVRQRPAAPLPWGILLCWLLGAALAAAGIYLCADGPANPAVLLTSRLFWPVGGALLSLALTWAALALQRRRLEVRRQQAQREAAEHRLAEQTGRNESLNQSLRFLTTGLEGCAAFTVDTGGQVLTWNEGAERLFGLRSTEIVGRSFFRLWADEELAGDKPGQLLAGGNAQEPQCGWCVRHGGKQFWARVGVTILGGQEGQPGQVLVVVRDLTESRHTQEELRRSRVLYRDLTETARDVVITIMPDGQIASLNRAFEKLTGWPRRDWLGRPFTSLVHPDDAGQAAQLLQRVGQDGALPVLELRLLRQAAGPVSTEFTATPQMQDGKLLGCLGIARDVSDRKRVEESLRLTEERLRQAQKMEAVGRLAGGVAHDFNNLLTVILGCSDMLLDSFVADPEARDLLEEIKKAGERAAGLTRQLLTFSRKQVVKPQLFDVNGLVTNLEKMLRRLIGEDVQLLTTLHAGPLPVKADPGQLEQVLLNLAVNARDAMPGGGTLTLTTGRGYPAGGAEWYGAEPRQSLYAVVTLTDTGCGMDEQVKKHLFEPFFTTKEPGRGTGLGLATVHGIVQQTGGHIVVVSAPGQGTTFRVYLPLAAEEAAPAAARPNRGGVPAGTETVLLVEDEEGVRALARRALAAKGYTVLEARDGMEALKLYERVAMPIHLVVTDVVMPLLGGVGLVRRLKERNPAVKALFMSGYHDSTLQRHGAPAGEAADTLQKPFKPDELTQLVRAILDGTPRAPAR